MVRNFGWTRGVLGIGYGTSDIRSQPKNAAPRKTFSTGPKRYWEIACTGGQFVLGTWSEILGNRVRGEYVL